MNLFLSLLTVVSIALLVGTEFAVSAFVNPVLWKLDAPARIAATRLFAALLGKAMPFWYAGNLLLLVAEALVRRSQPGLSLLAGAAGVWAAVIVLSLLVLVPINNRMAQLNPGASSDRDLREHKRWDALHRLRVAALCAAFIASVIAMHA
jgi:uncharacterized membrane protein